MMGILPEFSSVAVKWLCGLMWRYSREILGFIFMVLFNSLFPVNISYILYIVGQKWYALIGCELE